MEGAALAVMLGLCRSDKGGVLPSVTANFCGSNSTEVITNKARQGRFRVKQACTRQSCILLEHDAALWFVCCCTLGATSALMKSGNGAPLYLGRRRRLVRLLCSAAGTHVMVMEQL